MKWLIASDIHGSAKYTAELLECFEREKADRMLLLGDTLYHGPRNPLPDGHAPMEVAALLNRYADRIYGVRGNCDAEIDQVMLNFPILSDSLLLPVGERLCFVTHGHLFDEEHMPPLHRGDLFLYGHIHVPRLKEVNGVTFLNPGSVSLPKEDSERGYMTLTDTHFVWRTLAGREFMTFDA